MRSIGVWTAVVFTALASLVIADNAAIMCNETQSCPQDKPCCSQFGECGTGAYCLGGCNIKYSYNLDACMPMPRMTSFKTDFSNTSLLEKQFEYLGDYNDTDWVYTGWVDTADDAMIIQMPKDTTGTVISSTKYLWYGKVSATIKSSRDKGVIAAFILYSDVKDEIDFEFVGYNLTAPQTNFYFQGMLNYTNSANSTTTDTFANWHDYEIDWHEDHITWSIDGKAVRTLNRNETYNATSKTYQFPQTPSRVQLSLWPGGAASNGLGTIEWAGGEIDWGSADIQKYGYYYAFAKDIKVEAYDLPKGVNEEKVDDGEDFPHAYQFNSTSGLAKDIYITNKKTWLGNEDATGMDPENEEDKSSSSASAHKSQSSSRSAKSSAVSVDVPNINGQRTTASSSSIDYNPTMGVGGFIQDSQGTASLTTGSSSSQGNGSVNSVGIFGILASLAFGFLSIFI